MAVNTQVVKITKAQVDRMQPGDVLQDTELKGFRVRCQGKSKSFIAYYRINRRQRWFTLGRYGVLTVEQARLKAKEVLGSVAGGHDPAAQKDAFRKAPTVAECSELFLAHHVQVRLKPASQRYYRDIIEQLINPKIGSLKLRAITRQDVARLHDSYRNKSTYANRMLAIFSAMCNWAEQRGYRDENSNPCRLIPKYKEKACERYLTDAELTRLAQVLIEAEEGAGKFEAIRLAARRHGQRVTHSQRPALTASPMAVAAIRVLLFTGARHNEIVKAKWEYLDFDRGILRLPDSKTGQKVIILNSPALKILQSLPRVKDNPYIFAGEVEGKPINSLQNVWERIRKVAGLDDVRIHDLRHSYASTAVGAGFSLAITGRLLGHTQAATTQRYAHFADNPLRKANDTVGNRISTLMQPQHDSTIVNLRYRS